MAKKMKENSLKSQKKSLLLKIEGKLSESLIEFPKKLNEKKYKRMIHKAGKILTKSLAVNPEKESEAKSEQKKSKKNKQEVETENMKTS